MAFNPITSGYTLPSRDNQGGYRALYAGLFNDTSMTFTIPNSGASASMITAVGGTTVSFFTIAQRIEQGSATHKNTNSIENGSSFNEQTITLVIERPDNALSNWINTLNQGIWRVILQDNLGRYSMWGLSNGMYVNSTDGGPGKGYGDGNKITINLSGKEPYLPTMIAPTVAQSLIVP